MKREINIWAKTHANYHCSHFAWKYYFWMMIVELANENKQEKYCNT